MCGYYESIPGFRYWDVGSWKQYIQEYVAPIYSATTVLLDVRHELIPYLDHSLDTLADSKKDLLPFLIGGIKDGEYTKFSLAKLIRLNLWDLRRPSGVLKCSDQLGGKRD